MKQWHWIHYLDKSPLTQLFICACKILIIKSNFWYWLFHHTNRTLELSWSYATTCLNHACYSRTTCLNHGLPSWLTSLSCLNWEFTQLVQSLTCSAVELIPIKKLFKICILSVFRTGLYFPVKKAWKILFNFNCLFV